MQIVRKEVSPLLSQIKITLEPEDYSTKFEEGLKKYKNKAQVKGFRKGMIPMNTLKKMYGKSLLADIVYEVLNDKFNHYLNENKINTLGSPLPSEDEITELDFDVNNYKSFTFTFDVGIIPEYEISGVSEEDVYEIDDVQIEESVIEENFQDFLKRNGKQEVVENGIIEDMDLVDIEADELDDDGKVKENGWKTEFMIMPSHLINEEVKAEILGKSVGFTFNFDITSLEKGGVEYAEKYLLNRTEADKDTVIGNHFSGKVKSIKRQVAAQPTPEFFEGLADEKVKNAEDLREIIRQEMTENYSKQANNLLEIKIFERIKEHTNLEISKDFYKRLIKANESNAPEVIDDKVLDQSIETVKWSIIRDDLIQKHQIDANEGEIKNHFFKQVMDYMRYYPNMDYSIMFDFVEKQMKNKNAVDKAKDEILVGKLFAKLTEIVKKNPVTISSSEFEAKIKTQNQAQ
jgi:trigger factor